MIQSYLFDPIQVPSPGYVNEVNSCKLEEDDNVKFKGRTSSQALVPKNDPQSESLKHSTNRTASDLGEGRVVDKTWGSSNGVGLTPALQPVLDAENPQDDRGSWASTDNGLHPTQPFLEGQDVGGQECNSPAWEASPGVLNGDSNTPELGEEQSPGLLLPAPDYPVPWSTEDEPLQGGVHATSLNPTSLEPVSLDPHTHWDSLGEALTTESLNLYLKDSDPAPPEVPPLVHWRNGWQEAPGTPQSGPGDPPSEPGTDEDAAVAEALAALEAATAGEDVDEVD